MAKVDLKYVQRFRDRHGRERFYVRRPGAKRVALPGMPGSEAFMAAYATALASGAREIAAERTAPGSISALLVSYYKSGDFLGLAPSTQRNYRHVFERFRAQYGNLPVRGLQRAHVKAILDRLAATPGAARQLRKRLAGLMDYAVGLDWAETNPVRLVKPPKSPNKGFRPWTDEDIAKFEAHWPAGAKQHLALCLLLYTGQRRSDIPGMGRQHIRGGKIHVVQFKGRGGPLPTRLAIDIHWRLREALDRVPADQLTFLLTSFGKPFTHAGFTNWFSAQAAAAGLPPRSTPHGLRKAAARRLAEAGCTTKEIAAVTGHRTLKEVEHYSASADQERLAGSAIAKLGGQKANGTVKPPRKKVSNLGKT